MFRLFFTVLIITVSMAAGKPSLLSTNKLREDHLRDFNSLTKEDLPLEPEVSPGLFEGDIAGVTPELIRLGVNWNIFPEKKWINATVPYIISEKYLPEERLLIDTAISIMNFFTCVKFVPWDGQWPDYLAIGPIKKPSGCWSYVGRNGGQQLLSLERPTGTSYKCLGKLGKPIHELVHALGVFHEQSRPDRDKYIIFHPENTVPGALRNFRKTAKVEATTLDYPYDYNSVMHYGSHFFSQDKRHPTLVPKQGGARIGQRLMLSKLDCLKINELYACFEKGSFENNKYRAFCDILAY